jgi:hypothetical protein
VDAAAIAKTMSEVTAWHVIASNQVLRRLDTDPKEGLDINEVSRRL